MVEPLCRVKGSIDQVNKVLHPAGLRPFARARVAVTGPPKALPNDGVLLPLVAIGPFSAQIT